MLRFPTLPVTVALFAATLAAPAWAFQDESGHGKTVTPAAGDNTGPHARAPGQLDNLVIHEGTWLRTWGEDWFEEQAEGGASRYTWSDEAVQLTEDGEPLDGEFEGGWVDSEGEYALRYDEDEDEFAYWQYVGADQLTRGRQNYVQFCASCHGLDGNGYGRSAQHLRPPPRSFHQSSFKFTKVIAEYLPADEALVSLVKKGLHGTPMMPWALSDRQLIDIISYVKSLSPEGTGWRDTYAEVGGIVDIGQDPFAGDPTAGVNLGRDVYHRIGCYNCHPGYVPPSEINRVSEKDEDTTYRDDLTYPKVVKSSAYDVQGHLVNILPPDFTFHPIRSGWTPRDVALTVASGIGGAGMPQWKDSIPDVEIWAIGYYVRSLIDEYKDQPAKRAAFMGGLRQGN